MNYSRVLPRLALCKLRQARNSVRQPISLKSIAIQKPVQLSLGKFRIGYDGGDVCQLSAHIVPARYGRKAPQDVHDAFKAYVLTCVTGNLMSNRYECLPGALGALGHGERPPYRMFHKYAPDGCWVEDKNADFRLVNSQTTTLVPGTSIDFAATELRRFQMPIGTKDAAVLLSLTLLSSQYKSYMRVYQPQFEKTPTETSAFHRFEWQQPPSPGVSNLSDKCSVWHETVFSACSQLVMKH